MMAFYSKQLIVNASRMRVATLVTELGDYHQSLFANLGWRLNLSERKAAKPSRHFVGLQSQQHVAELIDRIVIIVIGACAGKAVKVLVIVVYYLIGHGEKAFRLASLMCTTACHGGDMATSGGLICLIRLKCAHPGYVDDKADSDYPYDNQNNIHLLKYSVLLSILSKHPLLTPLRAEAT